MSKQRVYEIMTVALGVLLIATLTYQSCGWRISVGIVALAGWLIYTRERALLELRFVQGENEVLRENYKRRMRVDLFRIRGVLNLMLPPDVAETAQDPGPSIERK